ncbi:MAG: PTS sugar transporter subunit IIB [Termitinemataceae bacterium]|nr:MAG: PTS sugar transporter subunit IIB [Termitinemataceae bacterium]
MTNIVLVFATRMTTTLLVQRLKKVAKDNQVDVNIKTVSEADCKNIADDVRIIMIGPQLLYNLDVLKDIYGPRGVKILVIHKEDFESIDAPRILADAMASIGQKELKTKLGFKDAEKFPLQN